MTLFHLRKVFKGWRHYLTEAHSQERKTNCKCLYERYLSGDKWMFVAILDCDKIRAITYISASGKCHPEFIRHCKATFSKEFMVVAGYCICQMPKKCKINSAYYQQNILTPTEDLPHLHVNAMNQVHLHQDKASSHTSRSTGRFLKPWVSRLFHFGIYLWSHQMPVPWISAGLVSWREHFPRSKACGKLVRRNEWRFLFLFSIEASHIWDSAFCFYVI